MYGRVTAPTDQEAPRFHFHPVLSAPPAEAGPLPGGYVQSLHIGQLSLDRVAHTAQSYGYAAFTVDPGSHPGGTTRIELTYYDVAGRDGGICSWPNAVRSAFLRPAIIAQ
jgi:hypothetical protein